MSFRGGRGGDRGARGGGGFRGRGGGRGGFQQSYGPPDTVQEMGEFVHACEGEMVCTSTNPMIPFFNAPIFTNSKSSLGKVDEILGPLNQVYFTVKPSEGIQATSFKPGDKVYIAPDKLLPLQKFLPKPKPPPGAAKVAKRPRGAGGDRGGRGFGGRGRGAPRGGFGGRGGGFSRGGARGGFGGRGGSGGFSRGGRGGTPRGRGRGSY